MTAYEFIKRIANFKDKEALRTFLIDLTGAEVDEAIDTELDEYLSADVISKEEYNSIARDFGEEEI